MVVEVNNIKLFLIFVIQFLLVLLAAKADSLVEREYLL